MVINMEQVCFGIDIGGTSIKAGIFNRDGKLLSKWDFSTKRIGRDFLNDIAESVRRKLSELNLRKENIIGIGAGIPGPILENGLVLETTNLEIGCFNLVEELEKLTGLRVKAGNDANVAALGESWQGGGKGYRNMVLVTLGTGVGGGIILNGEILAGNNGAAGEVGHITVNRHEKLMCGCGKYGCLEQYASATGMVSLAKRRLDSSGKPSRLREYDSLSAKILLDHAKEGDKLALSIVKEACEYLGIALANVAQTMNPEVFVIGGGVSKAGPILIDLIQGYFKRYVMESLKKTEFKLAELGNDAGIYGGAKMILALR